MKQSRLFVCFVLYLWDPRNQDASDCVLGLFGKLLMRRGAWAWFYDVWTCGANFLEYWMISSLKIISISELRCRLLLHNRSKSLSTSTAPICVWASLEFGLILERAVRQTWRKRCRQDFFVLHAIRILCLSTGFQAALFFSGRKIAKRWHKKKGQLGLLKKWAPNS